MRFFQVVRLVKFNKDGSTFDLVFFFFLLLFLISTITTNSNKSPPLYIVFRIRIDSYRIESKVQHISTYSKTYTTNINTHNLISRPEKKAASKSLKVQLSNFLYSYSILL